MWKILNPLFLAFLLIDGSVVLYKWMTFGPYFPPEQKPAVMMISFVGLMAALPIAAIYAVRYAILLARESKIHRDRTGGGL